MLEIKDIMTSPALTISPEKSVLSAAIYMHEKNLGGLPVIEDNKLLGIITSRDVRLNHPNRLVADAMTKKVIYCSPFDTIWDIAKLMEVNNIERLPVVNEKKVIGIVTKAQIIKSVTQLYDHLTGLHNSSFIYMIATKLVKAGCEICAILFDVNNFGEFNKKYGHVNGDKSLKTIANVLKGNIKSNSDYVCRFGGDEFVVITLRKLNEARKLTCDVINKIASDTTKAGIPVTATAGICGCKQKYASETTKHKEFIENLINKASLASTRAKEQGLKYVIIKSYL